MQTKVNPKQYLHLTFNTGGWTVAPGKVPLASDDVRATDIIPRLTLICQHTAPNRRRVGGANPSKFNLRENRTGVVGLNF